MNARERLFFRNVTLHKSVSYKKREDEKHVKDMRERFQYEQVKRADKLEREIRKQNTIFRKIYRWIISGN